MKNWFFLFLGFWQSLFGDKVLDYIQQEEKLRHCQIGICLLDLETNQEKYCYQGDQLFISASIQKILTSMAAVDLLGESFRFRTKVEIEGEVDANASLIGNVWIRGGGDPTLSLEFFPFIRRELEKNGIEKIAGKVYLDLSPFDTNVVSPFWTYEDMGNYFGAGATGLSLNQNMYRVYFKAGEKEGDPAEIVKIEPPLTQLTIHNEVRTGGKGGGENVCIYGTEYSPLQLYRGTIPLGETACLVKGAIPDPIAFAKEQAEELLEPRQGVEVIRNPCQVETRSLIEVVSPCLQEILSFMNQTSNNCYAEHLVKAMGAGSSKEGIARMGHLFEEKGIPLQIRDGSGLARNNLLSPKGCAALLRQIVEEKKYAALYASFPPTLHGFPSLKKGTLLAKSGTMSNIFNLAGYIALPSGKKYAVALFCNHYLGPICELRPKIATLLDHLID